MGRHTSGSPEEPDPREQTGERTAAGMDRMQHLLMENQHLRLALQDIVALALSGGEARERLLLMHRRAVAALSAVEINPSAPKVQR